MLDDLPALALATHRATRLITRDTLFDGPRDHLIRAAYDTAGRGHLIHATTSGIDEPGGWAKFAANDPHPPKLAELLTCSWCASVWAGMILSLLWPHRIGRWLVLALAASTAQHFIGAHE